MYRWEMDGISIGHMGDVGNPFTPEEYDRLFAAILMSFWSWRAMCLRSDLGDLKQVIDRVQPKLVIPMHFRTLRYKPRNMQWITAFLSHFDDEEVSTSSQIGRLSSAGKTLPESTRVLVLTHAL